MHIGMLFHFCLELKQLLQQHRVIFFAVITESDPERCFSVVLSLYKDVFECEPFALNGEQV